MKKLMLATVSALALGLAGVGVGQAAEPANTNANTPASNMQATPGTQQQAQGAQEQAQGAQEQASPGTEQQAAPGKLSREQVEQVQKQLKTAGIYKGRIDGKMGRETKEALKDFQQKNGLQSTGTLDEQTMAALQKSQPTEGSGGSAMPQATQQPNGEATGNQGNAVEPSQQQTPNEAPPTR